VIKVVKRVLVTFDDEQYDIIHNIKGIGIADAEKIKNMVIYFLNEKSYVKKYNESQP